MANQKLVGSRPPFSETEPAGRPRSLNASYNNAKQEQNNTPGY